MRTDNTLHFLTKSVRTFGSSGIQTWIFGGWAEELWGINSPRLHQDIDLLYPADDFTLLDAFIRSKEAANELEEIIAKRFPHKRAFRWHGVLFEIVLLQPTSAGHITNYFNLHHYEWPSDTLNFEIQLLAHPVPVASTTALRLYREQHAAITAAYQRHLKT